MHSELEKPAWNVLLVDDDEDDFVLVRAILTAARQAAYSVTWISEFSSGIEALLTGCYDAALIDYDLGERKGIELIAEATASFCSTPMLLLTGQGSDEVDLLAMQAGADDYINKNQAIGGLLERSLRYAIERRQADRKLRYAYDALLESDRRLLLGLQNAAVTVFSQDRDLRYTWVHNPLLGFPEEMVLGHRDDELVPLNEVDNLVAIKQQVIDTGEPIDREVTTTIHGKTSINLVTLEPLRGSDGRVTGLRGAAMDITHLRLLEAQQIEHSMVVEVQRRLLEHREMERVQIARNLHDGPVQDLIGIIFALQSAIEESPPGETLIQMEAIRYRAKKLAGELRQVCNELRPPSLMKFGLEYAIRSHVDEFRQNHTSPIIELDLRNRDGNLNDVQRLALFRIYQESLANTVRHAQANRVRIFLSIEKREIVFEILDDGCGFTPPDDWMDLADHGHLGLLGMRERAKAIGGQLEIKSAPGQGTSLRVRLCPQVIA